MNGEGPTTRKGPHKLSTQRFVSECFWSVVGRTLDLGSVGVEGEAQGFTDAWRKCELTFILQDYPW